MAQAIRQLCINDNLQRKTLRILQSLGRDKFGSTTIRPYVRSHGLLKNNYITKRKLTTK